MENVQSWLKEIQNKVPYDTNVNKGDWHLATMLGMRGWKYLETILRRFFVSKFLAVGLAISSVASADDWQLHQDMLKTRVVAASTSLASPGKLLYAWEAKLAPGWKTYWRSPGEAGLPVRVFADGVEQEIFYPIPERFELFGLETYGYSKYAVLPFELDANSTQSVDVDFMVCKEICVPFRAKYSLQVLSAGEVSIHDGKITKWLANVPEKTGDDGAGLEIVSAMAVGKLGHQKIIVDVKADKVLNHADMLAEINDMFHFGKPKMKLLAGGQSARFVLPAMTGKTPEDIKGQSVRLTFADGHGSAIERTLVLPMGRPR